MSDYRQLIAMSDVDVVDVCVPTPTHAEIVTAALAAGKHVIGEKPMARTLQQAQQIADAAAKAKGFFMPAMCIRFWPEYEWLKEAVKSGRYGKVKAATFRRLASMPPGWFRDGRISGGAILDLHVHDVDFVYHLFGMPQALFSRGYCKSSGFIDHVYTQYLYNDVPLVTAEGGWCLDDAFGFSMRYLVNFENATADYDGARPESLIVYTAGKKEVPQLAKEDGYSREIRYFVECLEKNQKPQRVTAADGVAGLKICDAENRSIDTGQIVPL
jgi:predicted dehydrogenase